MSKKTSSLAKRASKRLQKLQKNLKKRSARLEDVLDSFSDLKLGTGSKVHDCKNKNTGTCQAPNPNIRYTQAQIKQGLCGHCDGRWSKRPMPKRMETRMDRALTSSSQMDTAGVPLARSTPPWLTATMLLRMKALCGLSRLGTDEQGHALEAFKTVAEELVQSRETVEYTKDEKEAFEEAWLEQGLTEDKKAAFEEAWRAQMAPYMVKTNQIHKYSGLLKPKGEEAALKARSEARKAREARDARAVAEAGPSTTRHFRYNDRDMKSIERGLLSTSIFGIGGKRTLRRRRRNNKRKSNKNNRNNNKRKNNKTRRQRHPSRR